MVRHQLTWDCTLIDETQDASGEGLLQTVGLDTQAPEKTEEQPAPVTALNPNAESLLGSTVMPAAATDGKSWWQRFIERRRRPHAPGVWVVYFSLAALPLFGVGQAFIPAAKTDSRQNAFLLLCVYVACGLGLLMTTSFLALRRYLRQRRIEMPLTMAGTWLVMGGVLIVSLLIANRSVAAPRSRIFHLPTPRSSFRRARRRHKSLPARKERKTTRPKAAPAKEKEMERSRIETQWKPTQPVRHRSKIAERSITKGRSEGRKIRPRRIEG